MTERDFAYWLRGFFELEEVGLNPDKAHLTIKQVEMVKEHLNLVFNPIIKEDYPQSHIAIQRKIDRGMEPKTGSYYPGATLDPSGEVKFC